MRENKIVALKKNWQTHIAWRVKVRSFAERYLNNIKNSIFFSNKLLLSGVQTHGIGLLSKLMINALRTLWTLLRLALSSEKTNEFLSRMWFWAFTAHSRATIMQVKIFFFPLLACRITWRHHSLPLFDLIWFQSILGMSEKLLRAWMRFSLTRWINLISPWEKCKGWGDQISYWEGQPAVSRNA